MKMRLLIYLLTCFGIKMDRWIKQVTYIRKVDDKSMNRYEGSLSHCGTGQGTSPL